MRRLKCAATRPGASQSRDKANLDVRHMLEGRRDHRHRAPEALPERAESDHGCHVMVTTTACRATTRRSPRRGESARAPGSRRAAGLTLPQYRLQPELWVAAISSRVSAGVIGGAGSLTTEGIGRAPQHEIGMAARTRFSTCQIISVSILHDVVCLSRSDAANAPYKTPDRWIAGA